MKGILMAGRKKEALVQFHKKSILDTAEKLFSEKGIRQTTMDDIAKAADYSKSTLYVYFKSKDEIYEHIIYSHMCRLKESMEECTRENLDFEQCYFRIYAKLSQLYEQYPLYFPSILGNIPVDDQSLADSEILHLIYDVGEEINDCITEIFRQGIREGILSPDINILPSAFTLWAALGSLIPMANEKECYLKKRMNMDKSEFLQHSFRMLLQSLKGGC